MKTLFKTVAVALLLISHFAQSQNMNEGFAHLEKGEFNLAENFFSSILKDYPKNKTARLCYARAVGLNKQPEKALQLFVNLKTEFPDDLEIKLNYAESLLWNKNFADAKTYYSDLVKNLPR
jgi:tetratricopeptide (TPR) repeat protein